MTMPKTQRGDVILMQLFGGQMVRTAEPRLPNNANFVIVNKHGDYSGFLTWAEAQTRAAQLPLSGKEDGYYAVVER